MFLFPGVVNPHSGEDSFVWFPAVPSNPRPTDPAPQRVLLPHRICRRWLHIMRPSSGAEPVEPLLHHAAWDSSDVGAGSDGGTIDETGNASSRWTPWGTPPRRGNRDHRWFEPTNRFEANRSKRLHEEGSMTTESTRWEC